MKITKPTPNKIFTITTAPDWPAIEFETDGTGPHTWTWTLKWGAFTKTGTASTPNNKWDAKEAVTNFGGTLTVQAKVKTDAASVTVLIRGANPTSAEVTTYLATKPNSAGFDKILQHESKFKHFNASNEPVKSFDNGYGMCQLTTPTPTFEQVWNWKLNIDGGLKLFDQKRAAAAAFLTQSGRTHTDEQLKYETVCRWNGGSYHTWDATAGAWIRKANVLCDSKTGNIGWDMNDAENAGKTEADLRKRDKDTYSKPPQAGAHWGYFGVCYADAILG